MVEGLVEGLGLRVKDCGIQGFGASFFPAVNSSLP